MVRRKQNRKGKVLLVALSAHGDVIEELEVSYEDFYAGLFPLVDDDAYRSDRGIRALKGDIFDPSGNLQQTFENRYGEKGELVKRHIIFGDGRVVDD